jgi:molecular chaperone DnaJ
MSEQDYFKKDYYKVLGVDKKAEDAEIKKAFRKLSRKYHPDQNPNNASAEAKFKEISEANAVLSDKQERAKYDQIRAMAGGGAHFMGGGQPGAHGFEDLFGGGFSGGAQNVRFSTGGSGFRGNGGGGGLNDILSGLFGGGGAPSGFGHDPYGGGYGSPYSSQSAGGQSAHSSTGRPAEPQVAKTYRISYRNAIFGATLKHKFRSGDEIKFKVTPGTPSGKVLSIKNAKGASELVKIEVKVPDATKLNPEQQEQLKVALGLLG